MNAKTIMSTIVTLVIALLLISLLLPVGLDEIADANTTEWDSAVESIWDILPIMAILIPLGIFAGWVISSMRQ